MLAIDPSTEFGTRVQSRLAEEPVLWLTTVDRHGTPQPTPVWFLAVEAASGTEVLIASQPSTAKLRNVASRPRVALNLNATRSGGDVVVLTGAATHDESGFTAEELGRYDAKYAGDIRELGMTSEQFHSDYSEVIRVRVEKLRGF
ncbi:TIGR03667 family PPOX class F420-dependent oxidoreductase [Diaminobutyricimonas sp. LJ205]|uniref:TIGR03667 family PPOX class F420-dependent oxidoreductase n=1 Tax=Diaminobutyricimonas sp. LJ205 TaxID=2683590 RepID=UPI0012F50B6B|nr:TIGR03667 family PPOX class F420-dependent oxidoreductase [Diaminobutyricimonas sp. LJ205]